MNGPSLSAAAAAALLVVTMSAPAHAQTRKPTGQETAAIRDCAANIATISAKVSGSVCSISSPRLAPRRPRARPISAPRIATASKRGSGTISSTGISKTCSTRSTRDKRRRRAPCSTPGSATATPPAISTWTRFKARWRSRWAAPAPRAKRRGGLCCSIFSAGCERSFLLYKANDQMSLRHPEVRAHSGRSLRILGCDGAPRRMHAPRLCRRRPSRAASRLPEGDGKRAWMFPHLIVLATRFCARVMPTPLTIRPAEPHRVTP
jgi:hypothetical protein